MKRSSDFSSDDVILGYAGAGPGGGSVRRLAEGVAMASAGGRDIFVIDLSEPSLATLRSAVEGVGLGLGDGSRPDQATLVLPTSGASLASGCWVSPQLTSAAMSLHPRATLVAWYARARVAVSESYPALLGAYPNPVTTESMARRPRRLVTDLLKNRVSSYFLQSFSVIWSRGLKMMKI